MPARSIAVQYAERIPPPSATTISGRLEFLGPEWIGMTRKALLRHSAVFWRSVFHECRGCCARAKKEKKNNKTWTKTIPVLVVLDTI